MDLFIKLRQIGVKVLERTGRPTDWEYDDDCSPLQKESSSDYPILNTYASSSMQKVRPVP
jgi:hypothetical protein